MRALAMATSLSLLPACALAGGDRYHRQLGELRKLADEDEKAQRTASENEPFADAAALERGALVREVLLRNPTIDAARHGWRAAGRTSRDHRKCEMCGSRYDL